MSLSCSFSSVEHEESCSEDETGTVEPYQYEPEEPSHASSSDDSDGDDSDGSSDEGRIGNVDW